MIVINNIFEDEWILEFLKKRNLLEQYLKSIKMLTSWIFGKLDFKIRQPKKNLIYSFRINKQYRAFCYFRDNWIFVIFEINDHSN